MSSDGRKRTQKSAGGFYSTVFLCVKNNKVSNVSKTFFFSLRQKSPHKTVQNKNSPANFFGPKIRRRILFLIRDILKNITEAKRNNKSNNNKKNKKNKKTTTKSKKSDEIHLLSRAYTARLYSDSTLCISISR